MLMTFMMIMSTETGEFLGAHKPKSRRMCLEFEGTVEIGVTYFGYFVAYFRVPIGRIASSVMLRPKACSRKACYKYNSP